VNLFCIATAHGYLAELKKGTNPALSNVTVFSFEKFNLLVLLLFGLVRVSFFIEIYACLPMALLITFIRMVVGVTVIDCDCRIT
jgi:hypothetical protein